MKRLYRIVFDRESVDSLQLHACLSRDEVSRPVEAVWGTSLDEVTHDLTHEAALDRAVEHLKPRLREFLRAYPVDGRCL